jgi:hypothetical protein
MIHDGLPWSKVFGQVSPGARRACDPQHSFDAPPSLVCRAASFGLRGLEQRTQLFPEGIGELGQTWQTDRMRQRVWRRNRRGLTGATLLVAYVRAGLMRASEARPPHDPGALFLGQIDPTQEMAHFCQTQRETRLLAGAFFSRVRCRTTASTACAKRANVMNRYQARYVRTSY